MRTQDLAAKAQALATRTPRRAVSALISTALMTAAPVSLAEDDGDETPFDVADVYAELNNTDEDLGFHALIDGDEWKRLSMEDPNERRMLAVMLRGRLRQQGLTELFFESAEPNFADLSPDEFFDRFPEGPYEIEGITLDGEELESTDVFSHLMPAPAGDLMVNEDPAAANCDVDPLPSTSAPVTISWSVSPLSHPSVGTPSQPIDIVKTQLVLAEAEDEEIVASIDLPPGVTEYTFSEDLTDLGETWKYEVLLVSDTGNRTAIESCFDLE